MLGTSVLAFAATANLEPYIRRTPIKVKWAIRIPQVLTDKCSEGGRDAEAAGLCRAALK
jgi:hypothetical protein